MISFDTNILFPAVLPAIPGHTAAVKFMTSLDERDDVAVSEFVLTELYGLLRNPALLSSPLTAPGAAEICTAFRAHPRWRLLGFPQDGRALHDALWKRAADPAFPRRRIYDMRMALALLQQGVTEFATVNVRDFGDAGFERVWNPLASG